MPIPAISYVLVISWYGFTCGNLIPATASWVRTQNVRISVSGDEAASLRTRREARERPYVWLRGRGHDRLTGTPPNPVDESVPTRWNASGPNSNMWMNWNDDPRNSGE